MNVHPERTESAAWAPSSLSNLGPGFDALGLAIDGWGDIVTVTVRDEPGIGISYAEDSVWRGPTDPAANTAGRAAQAVLAALDIECGLHIQITKRMRAGSGLGSSAASAVAASLAVNHLFGSPLSRERLIGPAVAGESVASGAVHADNVLPALMGGLVINSADGPEDYARLEPGDDLHLAVIVPEQEVLTQSAREMLPDRVPLRLAAANASRLALLVEAFGRADWVRVGRLIMSDALVEPVRASLLPYYDDVRGVALRAGAHGCAISGSGPAMFAVCSSRQSADQVLAAMIEAVQKSGAETQGLVTVPESRGARILTESRKDDE